MGVAVNGRFRTRQVTGVERYAQEVTCRIQPAVRLITPGKAYSGPWGHLWEQFTLPHLVQPGETLWSPANSGPLRCRNQVLSVHDLSVFDHPEWFKPAYALWHRNLLPRLVKSVRKVITMSNFTRDRLIRYFDLPPEKVYCIAEGVDLAHFHPQPAEEIGRVRQKFGLDSDYLLMVATLEPRKNFDRLLKAWNQVNDPKTPKQLVIAGAKYRVFKDIKIEKERTEVLWLGYVPENDLPALFSGAQAYILPSLYEGFGLSALEAMACGTPVAAANSGALPEVMGDSAILFNPCSVDSICAALERVLYDIPLRESLLIEGFKRAEQCTWEHTAQQTAAVLYSDRL